MRDFATLRVEGFDLSTKASELWVDLGRFETASVEVVADVTLTATLELVYGNAPKRGKSFSSAKTLTAANTIQDYIDFGSTGCRLLGIKVTTAGAASEKCSVFVYAASGTGTGREERLQLL